MRIWVKDNSDCKKKMDNFFLSYANMSLGKIDFYAKKSIKD